MDFEDLANQHKDAVYRQLMRACGNREDAEDVLIEALLKAYRNLDQLRETGAFRAWLAQIGRRAGGRRDATGIGPRVGGNEYCQGADEVAAAAGHRIASGEGARSLRIARYSRTGGRGSCHPAQYHVGGDEVPTEPRPDKRAEIPGRGAGPTRYGVEIDMRAVFLLRSNHGSLGRTSWSSAI